MDTAIVLFNVFGAFTAAYAVYCAIVDIQIVATSEAPLRTSVAEIVALLMWASIFFAISFGFQKLADIEAHLRALRGVPPKSVEQNTQPEIPS